VRDEELTDTETSGKQLNWIPAGEIVAASGRRGRMVDRLKADSADIPLLAVLSAWGVAPTSPGVFGVSG
jgi:hypothetical protein